MHGAFVLCVALSSTWSVLHILAEGLELCFPDSGVLVEHHRVAQFLGGSAQSLRPQFLSVILQNIQM